MDHPTDGRPNGAPDFAFPILPIVTPEPAARSTREKYGSLFYLGIAGLLVATTLVAWFAHGVWSLRSVWTDIYILHEDNRPAPERIRAAYRLAHDSRVNQRQYWDMCLRRPLPDLARYLLAEALTAEAATADPRGYALAVARSPEWPGWLRLLLIRPIAYSAAQGFDFPREAMDELAHSPDPILGLWARFAISCDGSTAQEGRSELDRRCQQPGAEQTLACLLAKAAHLPPDSPEQHALLDEATLWNRSNHPESARIWRGWSVKGGDLVESAQEPASPANASRPGAVSPP